MNVYQIWRYIEPLSLPESSVQVAAIPFSSPFHFISWTPTLSYAHFSVWLLCLRILFISPCVLVPVFILASSCHPCSASLPKLDKAGNGHVLPSALSGSFGGKRGEAILSENTESVGRQLVLKKKKKWVQGDKSLNIRKTRTFQGALKTPAWLYRLSLWNFFQACVTSKSFCLYYCRDWTETW